MTVKTAKRRDFKHFRMQELDCVISKSRLELGEREREIQLAQLCMQDLEFDRQKKVPQTTKEDSRRRRIREDLRPKVNASVEGKLISTLILIRHLPDKRFSVIRQPSAINKINEAGISRLYSIH